MNSGLDSDVGDVDEDDGDLPSHHRRRRDLAIPWADDAGASGDEEPPPPVVRRRRSESNGASRDPEVQPDAPVQADPPAEQPNAGNGAAAPPADLTPGQWFVEAPEHVEAPDGFAEPAPAEVEVADWGDPSELADVDYADVDYADADDGYHRIGYDDAAPSEPAPEVCEGPPPTPLEERLDRRASKLSYRGTRVEAVYDVGGPKVRLGVLWFLLAWAGFALGPLGVGAVFVTTATVAALQVAAHLMIAEDTNSRVTAGVLTAAIGTSAIFDARTVGIVILVSVVVAFVVASQTIDREMTVQVAGLTMRAALPLGISMAALLYLHRVDAWVFMILFGVVSMYDAGNFLVGTGSRRVWVGPLAGMIGAATVVFGAAGFEAPPLTEATTWLIGGVTVLVCPLGQIVGSYMLPRPDARAPALRRLDTYLVAAPTMLGLFLAIGGNRPLL